MSDRTDSRTERRVHTSYHHHHHHHHQHYHHYRYTEELRIHHHEMSYSEPPVLRPDTAVYSSSSSTNVAVMDVSTLNPKRPAPQDEKGDGKSEELGAVLRPPLKIARTSSSISMLGIDGIPPDNFALVSGKVYRSSFPCVENFGYLKKLGLKTILTLVPEPYPEPNAQFLKENRITHYQIGMPGKDDSTAFVPDDKITAALRIVLDRRNHPILIHCNKGKHRTGCVVGCLRKFQAWPMPLVIDEYRRYAGAKSRENDQNKIAAYNLEPCWDIAREHSWIPSSIRIDSDDEEADRTPLSIMGPAAIKAQ